MDVYEQAFYPAFTQIIQTAHLHKVPVTLKNFVSTSNPNFLQLAS
jgi:hypothetical protein